MVPTVHYLAIIDVDKRPHQRSFPISHMIPPGDVERFQVEIGATKSCALNLRFKFMINKENIIESPEFSVKIWNPRGPDGWFTSHLNGANLYEKIAELESQDQIGELDIWQKDRLQALRLRAKIFLLQLRSDDA